MAERPLRLMVVMPSWLGDAVMATPALRLLREALRGSLIGALVRPGIDEVLAGSDFFDQVHVERARGVMGPKMVAAKVRPVRYDTALLLTNSFSTALITRLAWIPRRVGYDRDGRGLLLTDRLKPQRRGPGSKGRGGFAPVSAVDYYLDAARAVLGEPGVGNAAGGSAGGAAAPGLHLGTTEAGERAADEVIARATPPLSPGRPMALLNPGANDPAKRWPVEGFAAIAAELVRERGMNVLVNGSPGEMELAEAVRSRAAGLLREGGVRVPPVVSLAAQGITISSLKAVVRRCAVMVTNDTGPRHFAAAFGVPAVALFGPTDPRWTALPPGPGPEGMEREVCLVADPTLPREEVADDHPDRCRIDRIGVEAVREALERVLKSRRGAAQPG